MDLVKLHEICDLKNGFAFKSKDYVDSSNTLSCRMSSIRPGGNFDLEHNKRFLPDDFVELYSDYLLEEGDIVIAMTDLAGDPKILGVPTIVRTNGKNLLQNQRVGKLIVKDNSKVHIPFLQYALNRPINKSYYKKFAGGGLQINVGKKEILNNSIPLPPLNTQKKIAAILDEADKLHQLDKQLIEKYDALTQSFFLDMFGDPVANPKGWEHKPLVKITSKIGSGSTPRGGKESYREEGISLIRSLNIYDNKFKYKNLAHISDEQANKLKNVIVEENDVLFNITGASICRSTIVPNDVLPARVNQHVSILRPLINKLNPLFLNHFLISENVKNQLLGVGSGGGAIMQAITKKQLTDLEVIIPPIELQNQFAERVQAIEAQKAQAQQSLQKSEELFNSLLQKAFKGELI
ncbi:restriction endonuclease subunit S [Xanthomarina spongicola]|uniref:Type I restriction enzyme S subunit n=1 Tax=Xanthomarina spongicola TaxID=570520 RepID=A0A316DNG6_9FLAO|nr:restriction endonuclease subunit S [Xanthomarina spongicola]PWK19088.1 type I restriction enzyme S subunit [Xanthomarina spongicola]